MVINRKMITIRDRVPKIKRLTPNFFRCLSISFISSSVMGLSKGSSLSFNCGMLPPHSIVSGSILEIAKPIERDVSLN